MHDMRARPYKRTLKISASYKQWSAGAPTPTPTQPPPTSTQHSIHPMNGCLKWVGLPPPHKVDKGDARPVLRARFQRVMLAAEAPTWGEWGGTNARFNRTALQLTGVL